MNFESSTKWTIFLIVFLSAPSVAFSDPQAKDQGAGKIEHACNKATSLGQPSDGAMVRDDRNHQNALAGYKEFNLEEALGKEFSGVSVKCTSCFRSKAVQASICKNPDPSSCAKPDGKGDHQQLDFATCDLVVNGSLSKDAVCEKLFKFCSNFPDPAVRGHCAIGGYPSGSFHFSMGVRQMRPRAWNQCQKFSDKLKMNSQNGALQRLDGAAGALGMRFWNTRQEKDYIEENGNEND